ncbi:hypothetical protein CAPTEDRAFT_208199, partial [Capitella teleta]
MDSESIVDPSTIRGVDTPDAPAMSLSASYPSSAFNSSLRKTPQPVDPYRVPKRQDSRGSKGSSAFINRQVSVASTGRRSVRACPKPRNRKDSVLRMAVDGFTGALSSSRRSKRRIAKHARSFAPTSISSALDDSHEPESLK